MFIIVQFGENEYRVLNTNCKCISLLQSLRDSSHQTDLNLDLSDEDGNVKLVQDNLERYANEFLAERERFVLLQVDKNEAGDCQYIPLLKSESVITERYLSRLASKANGGGRLSVVKIVKPRSSSSKGGTKTRSAEGSAAATLGASGGDPAQVKQITRSASTLTVNSSKTAVRKDSAKTVKTKAK